MAAADVTPVEINFPRLIMTAAPPPRFKLRRRVGRRRNRQSLCFSRIVSSVLVLVTFYCKRITFKMPSIEKVTFKVYEKYIFINIDFHCAIIHTSAESSDPKIRSHKKRRY